MKTHGYPGGGELIAFVLMLAAAICTLALAFVAVAMMIADRSSVWWWWAAAASAVISFGAWLYL